MVRVSRLAILIALILVNATVAGKAPAKQPSKCCGEGNLAFGRSTKASSEETGKKNFARNAVDGDLRTRWCAAGAQANETWQVDLGEPQHVKSLRIHWEKANAAYRYRVDASADGESWGAIVDQSNNKKVQQVTPHKVNSPDTRYLRLTFLGSSTGVWGSIWEFEAYDGDLPELPKGKAAGGSAPAATISDVKAPDGFNVTLFGAPPTVNYPACLTAAPTGEVFVGVDEQGSLGKEKGRGKVLRCIDADGDGVADKINEFARMDHPRGLIYDNGSLWVLHPPLLSVYHDDDLDGVADRSETLVTGISTDQVEKRGADHTTNGIRMGIDGWIYIAVGDFGFTQAKGKDGTTLGRRGGGIVRVRPDGTEMEIYCWGLRNIMDVSIDPYMNIFTRDNTNDGGGWDIRVSHILQTANYGYPSLYKNFSDEIMPPLGDYGGGSGCGTMYLNDTRWPASYGDAFYSCDWGRSEVYRHNLPNNGATFDPHQELFLKIPRPTDIDVDGSGRMYVSSWKNGKFKYGGPNVGFVVQITPQNYLPSPFPDLGQADVSQLVEFLSSPSAVYRLHSQREILRRGRSPEMTQQLVDLAKRGDQPLAGRVAAIFTMAQLDGAEAIDALVELSRIDGVREFALRALTDRKPLLSGVPIEPFLAALKDENPRVRAQALIGLGRLGDVQAAEKILPLTKRPQDQPAPTKSPYWNQPDPGRVLQHLAVRALADLNAVDVCREAIGGPHSEGALRALKYMHDGQAVKGLAFRLSTTFDKGLRQEILTALIRLYHREGEYKSGWWGTRPDTSGPYFDRQTWAESETIANVIRTALSEADKETAEHIATQLARHEVAISGLPKDLLATRSKAELEVAVKVQQVDKNNKNQIGNMAYEEAVERALAAKGNAELGRMLFQRQQCNACHTYANGQQPKGPHLVDIGKRYKRAELVESILKPSAKIAQGFDTYGFITIEGKVVTGFVVSESADDVRIRQINGLGSSIPLDDIEARRKQEQSMMPEGIVNNLTAEELASLLAYLESLK